MMNADHYTYRVTWSPEDGEYVGLCVEFPSLSWLARTPESALKGIRRLVAEGMADLQSSGETVPTPLAEKHWGRISLKVFLEACAEDEVQAAQS